MLFFSDDDIIATRPEEFDPFPGLAETFNGISATYPEPASLWESREAPARYNPPAVPTGLALTSTIAGDRVTLLATWNAVAGSGIRYAGRLPSRAAAPVRAMIRKVIVMRCGEIVCRNCVEQTGGCGFVISPAAILCFNLQPPCLWPSL